MTTLMYYKDVLVRGLRDGWRVAQEHLLIDVLIAVAAIVIAIYIRHERGRALADELSIFIWALAALGLVALVFLIINIVLAPARIHAAQNALIGDLTAAANTAFDLDVSAGRSASWDYRQDGNEKSGTQITLPDLTLVNRSNEPMSIEAHLVIPWVYKGWTLFAASTTADSLGSPLAISPKTATRGSFVFRSSYAVEEMMFDGPLGKAFQDNQSILARDNEGQVFAFLQLRDLITGNVQVRDVTHPVYCERGSATSVREMMQLKAPTMMKAQGRPTNG